jgi:hypothetical protein
MRVRDATSLELLVVLVDTAPAAVQRSNGERQFVSSPQPQLEQGSLRSKGGRASHRLLPCAQAEAAQLKELKQLHPGMFKKLPARLG